MAIVQNFQENDAYSQRHSGEVEQILSRYFTDILTVSHIPNANNPAQKLGFDLLVMLRSGRTITIDYKTRRGTFGDILLYYENVQSDGRRTPALMNNEALQMDYLLAYYPATGRSELLDFAILRTLWKRHGREWINKAMKREAGFSIIESQSEGRNGIFTRRSLCVPRREVWGKIYKMGEKV